MPDLHYRLIRLGVERLPVGDVARHVHRDGYANVVLEGSFVEAAFAGCSRAGPGDVLLHAAFDAHANRSARGHALRLLRLPWDGLDEREGRYRVADPDQLARLAESDLPAALQCLHAQLGPPPATPQLALDWVERLANDLKSDTTFLLSHWAERNGLAPETVSREFKRRYGVSPQRFRLESRTRQAWRRIVRHRATLTIIAHETGFADQAHMTRSVVALTGCPPAVWRARVRP